VTDEDGFEAFVAGAEPRLRIAAQDPAEMQEAVKHFLEEAMRSPGAFGPEVEVADDARDQDKLIGFLGRKP